MIEDVYSDLLAWNRWFYEHRMNDSGALCWGSEKIPELYGNRWETDGVHSTYGAALESGLDNSPMYDDIPFNKETNRLELEDVGLTGLYILDCRSLIELAKIIGRDEDVDELSERMEKACEGLETLWDEENGFYYNRRTDTGEFSRRISPTNFYALFSPDVSIERQRRIATSIIITRMNFTANGCCRLLQETILPTLTKIIGVGVSGRRLTSWSTWHLPVPSLTMYDVT